MAQFVKRIKYPEISKPPGKKLLTLSLGDEEYAIDILKVQEIKAHVDKIPVTKISDAPAHIKGIAYLHDLIIPIADLRIFYHLPINTDNEFEVFIVLNIDEKSIGIIVDSVLEIIELTPSQIKPAPEFCSIIQRDYIEGIATVADRLIIVLDIEKLIFSEELQIARHAAA